MRAKDSLTPFETLCITTDSLTRLLSKLYKTLLDLSSQTTPYYIRECENELDSHFPADVIDIVTRLAHTSSVCSQMQEPCFKFLTHWYRVQIYPSASAHCWRGCKQRGKFIHIWWDCPRIKPFLAEIWNLNDSHTTPA